MNTSRKFYFVSLSAFVFFLLLQAGLRAQTASENQLKNFRFGLKIAPAINWYAPDDKKITPGGARLRFGYGLITEFRLSNVVSISTGIDGDIQGGKLVFDSASYYLSSDLTMVKRADVDSAKLHNKTITRYLLNDRSYRITYVTIPVVFKLKTKEIGYFTYFGQFGIDISVRAKAKANDNVTLWGTSQRSTNAKIDISKDMSLFRFGLNAGLGTEYNFSGSTSAMISLTYHNSFNNVLDSRSAYLIRNSGTNEGFTQAANYNAIILTLGVLF